MTKSTLEAYLPEKHFEMVCNWLTLRGKPPFEAHLLPKIGFIVPDVAASFLYRTDSLLGLIENSVANPESTQETREKAFTEIFDALINKAKSVGIRSVMSMTAIESLRKFAVQFGGVPVARRQTVYMRRV